jgi:hypothetical protein
VAILTQAEFRKGFDLILTGWRVSGTSTSEIENGVDLIWQSFRKSCRLQELLRECFVERRVVMVGPMSGLPASVQYRQLGRKLHALQAEGRRWAEFEK